MANYDWIAELLGLPNVQVTHYQLVGDYQLNLFTGVSQGEGIVRRRDRAAQRERELLLGDFLSRGGAVGRAERPKKASLEAWFDERGADWCAAVEVCGADMWEAYHEAARAKLPNACQTVDRFHVMKNLNAALTQARRAIQKHADEATQAVLKGCRWLLVKNAENLSDEERLTLQTMLAHSAELKACYELKETFRAWFNQPCPREEAAQGLDEWIAKVEGSGFRALKAFVQTLTNWRERILNYFDGRYSNGYAEGVNTKVKLINREAFGYRNFENFRLHLLMAFGQ